MPVELNTLITAVVRAVLDQLDTRPASVAQVLAPRDEALARQVEKRLGSAMQVCFQGQSAGQEPALYILPELSCPDMADLANIAWGSMFVEHSASAINPANNFFLIKIASLLPRWARATPRRPSRIRACWPSPGS